MVLSFTCLLASYANLINGEDGNDLIKSFDQYFLNNMLKQSIFCVISTFLLIISESNVHCLKTCKKGDNNFPINENTNDSIELSVSQDSKT